MRDLRIRIERGEQDGPRLFNSGPYFGTARTGWRREITADEIRAEVDYWIAQGVHLERGTYYDATVSAYGYWGRRDPQVYEYFEPEMDYLTPYARQLVESRLPRRVNEQFERIYWVKRDLVKKFYQLGGGNLITLGTDHPSWGEFFTPFSVHRELHVLVLAGIPPAAVLRIATINSARALRVADRLGTIERGKLADLVIMQGNPLADIRHTRNVRQVVKHGVRYDPRTLREAMRGKLGPTTADELTRR